MFTSRGKFREVSVRFRAVALFFCEVCFRFSNVRVIFRAVSARFHKVALKNDDRAHFCNNHIIFAEGVRGVGPLLRKNVVFFLLVQKFVVTLHCQIRNNREMKEDMELMLVTTEEKELLEIMRNYNRSYPNGYPQLLWYAQRVLITC